MDGRIALGGKKLKKVLLFTHTDLDGAGCSLVARQYCDNNNYELTIYYCSAAGADKRVSSSLYSGEMSTYDEVYIADLSISKELNELILHNGINLMIIDHHKSAESLSSYDNCLVSEVHEGRATSGTELLAIKLLNYERSDHLIPIECMMSRYICAINDYDSWLWVKDPNFNNTESGSLNVLLSVLGVEQTYLEMYYHSKEASESLIPPKYRNALVAVVKMTDTYVENAVSKCRVVSRGDYQVGVIEADQHVSEVGVKAREVYPELDYFVVVGTTHVSLRAGKTSVDLSEIAKSRGGGGHYDSAGYPIPEEVRTLYLESII